MKAEVEMFRPVDDMPEHVYDMRKKRPRRKGHTQRDALERALMAVPEFSSSESQSSRQGPDSESGSSPSDAAPHDAGSLRSCFLLKHMFWDLGARGLNQFVSSERYTQGERLLIIRL